MLVNILSEYLQIPITNADSLIKLLSYERRWQEKQHWKGETYDLSNMKTQADLITFLQAIGQSQWFKGHDYSKLPDQNEGTINEHYFSLFEKIGLTQAIGSTERPDYSVILGATEPTVLSRVEALQQDLIAGFSPKENLIFGLGCNRLLGVSALKSEANSAKKLCDMHQEPTEMNMVTLFTYTCIEQLSMQDSRLETLSYKPVNTTSTAKSREEVHCVKTADTATSLKNAIEKQSNFSKKQNPVNVTIYSNQPFVLRQQRDVQMQLGSNYIVFGVGSGLTRADFEKNSKCVSEF